MRSYDERARDILAQRDEKVKEITVKRKKAARLGVIAAVLALSIIGASVFMIIANKKDKNNSIPEETTAAAYNDGVIGERVLGESDGAGIVRDGVTGMKGSSSYSKDDGMPAPSAVEDEMLGGIAAEAEYGYDYSEIVNAIDAVAGTLTAGEWKDADNIADWIKLLSKEDWSSYVDSRKLDSRNVITVKVKDGDSACYNVPVKLIASQETVYTAKTDINGCAYLFYNIAGENKTPDSVVVGDETVNLDGRTELEIEAKDAAIKVTALDLMLMIDTTGSMGDELEYIKAELYDVVERVAKADESLSIRVSVNFYRDEGDEYVVKYYDFRTDINECIEQLKEQHADGGGDTPEAVHTALDNAVKGHTWREEAVKICFIVLDAPPHAEYEIQGINAELLKTVKAAAEQGIRIIPVASSGVDTETEFLLRSYALMTGGTYVFITDDSGVGYGHKEAEVGEHTVEYLNECMIRIVCEYCGIYSGEKVPYTPPVSQNQQ